MANIALLTASTSHNAATACRDALVAGGHTVTLVADSGAGTHDFTPYDLIVEARSDSSRTASNAGVLTPLNEGGKPMIIGMLQAGQTATVSTSTALTKDMGLTGNVAISSAETLADLAAPNSHLIVADKIPGTAQLFGPSNYVGSVASGNSHIGTAFMEGVANQVSNLPIATAIASGTAKIVGNPTGANIVIFPVYLISGAYNALHQQLLNRAVEWALTGTVVYPPEVQVPELRAYAVMGYPGDAAGVSDLRAYAVMDAEHAQVYASSLRAYAVMAESSAAPVVGQTLGHRYDTWDNSPTGYAYQWLRDDVDIAGATAATYLLAAADAGAIIKLRKHATNEFGTSEPVVSAGVGPIAASS